MFTEEQKTAYQNLTAPPQLRRRVLTMAAQMPDARAARPSALRRWGGAAIAASLVLVMSAALLMPRGDVSVSASEPELMGATMPFSLEEPVAARALRPSVSVELTLRCEEETALYVSEGCLSNGRGERLDSVAAGETTVFWQVDGAEEETEYRFAAAEKTLRLYFDRAQERWVVTED